MNNKPIIRSLLVDEDASDAKDFSVRSDIFLGLAEAGAEESVQFKIETPGAFKLSADKPVTSGYNSLFTAKWDEAALRAWLDLYVAEIEEETWDKAARMVARLGLWEFDDYKEYVPPDVTPPPPPPRIDLSIAEIILPPEAAKLADPSYFAIDSAVRFVGDAPEQEATFHFRVCTTSWLADHLPDPFVAGCGYLFMAHWDEAALRQGLAQLTKEAARSSWEGTIDRLRRLGRYRPSFGALRAYEPAGAHAG